VTETGDQHRCTTPPPDKGVKPRSKVAEPAHWQCAQKKLPGLGANPGWGRETICPSSSHFRFSRQLDRPTTADRPGILSSPYLYLSSGSSRKTTTNADMSTKLTSKDAEDERL